MIILQNEQSEGKKMKLYHYAPKGNTVLEKGLLSFAKNPDANLKYYIRRSGSSTFKGILKWFESCFKGRSRAVRVFTEPIRWNKNSLSLKDFVEKADLFSIDIDALQRDGLIDDIYFSPSVANMPNLRESNNADEVLIRLYGLNDISQYPIDWSLCNDKLHHRFEFVPYYLLIIKGGIIPPKYIKLES